VREAKAHRRIGLVGFLVTALLLTFACQLAPPVAETPSAATQRPASDVAATEMAGLGTQVAGLSTVTALQATPQAAQGTVTAIQGTRIAALATDVASQVEDQLAGTRVVEALQTPVARNGTTVAHLATRVGAVARDAGTPRPSPSMTPHRSVVGGVELDEGRCCVGGVAGEVVTVTASFTATSPVGPITEMRVIAGILPATATMMTDVAWAPFEPTRVLSVPVALNWTGFHVSVQYRDAAGNLSPIVTDDISIEGESPTSTPTP
jgi:hypothetical protein